MLDFLAAWSECLGEASTMARSRMQGITRRTPLKWEQAVASLRDSGVRGAWRLYLTAATAPTEPDDARIERVMKKLSSDQPGSGVAELLARLGDIADQIPELGDPLLQENLIAALAQIDGDDWRDAAAIERRLLHWRLRQPITDGELDACRSAGAEDLQRS